MSRTRKYLFGPIIVLSMIVTLAFSVFNVSAVDPIVDLSVNGSNDVVNGAYWENLVPHTTATGTGTFHSFLRVQKDGSEKGYNHGLKQNVFDEKESFTDPMLLTDVPTLSFEGASYREFQLDVNENDAFLSLDRFQVYLTNEPNDLTYNYSAYSFGSNALKIYDTVGYVLKLGANGGSGKREYRVLIPSNLFVGGYTHVVLFTEHGLTFDTSDGFEEWGVEKQSEAIPTIEVIKTALTLSLPEPGDWVTYKVDILNTSDSTDPITINSLTDMIDAGAPYSISGSIFNNQALTDATTFPFTILSGATKTVYFKSLVSGEPRTVHDVVTASGVDDENIPVTASDDANVIITDVLPVITVNKSVVPPTLAEPGGIFHYSFSVTNNSVEPVHLTKITDLLPSGSTVIIYEWLSGATKIWLNPGETSQVFTSDITYSEFGTYTNTAWGYALDNEGNEAKDDDIETVNVTDVLPTIQLIKTASPSSRAEPGGLFTYTFTVKNLSVEPVMLTKVVDDKLGTLYEWHTGDPEIWIAVGGEYLLPGSFTKTYTDAGVYPNKGEAWAKDNEANLAYDDDSRSVEVTDVLPIITVNKTVTPPTLPEPGGMFHYSFSVTNNSVEPVHLTKIIDMLPNGTTAIIYEWASGDPEIWLNPGETSQVFTSHMTYSEFGTYTNTAWGYALDNEGNEAKDDDSETVNVTDVLPDISVTKTANKTSIPFSGADVIFTFVIRNNSVENVEIFYINDSVFGDLLPEALVQFGGSPISIAPESTFTFTITRWVEGEAGGTHYDVVTTKGRDNENNEDTATDDETIRFYWYGFTPGYWKNHPEQWPTHTLFATTQTVRSVFTVDSRYLFGDKLDMNKDGKEDTLMDALNYKGGNDLKGKAQILLRAAVAALLNESALRDYFPPYDSIDELKAAVNAALATGNKTTIGMLASQLDYWNNGLHEFPD